jgi:hypothetical protein
MDHVTHLGLDVHKDSIAVATLRPGQEIPEERVIPNTPEGARSCGVTGTSHDSARATKPVPPATTLTAS